MKGEGSKETFALIAFLIIVKENRKQENSELEGEAEQAFASLSLFKKGHKKSGCSHPLVGVIGFEPTTP